MTTELSVQEQQQVEKPSRRNFLKWGVVGGLLALPVGVSLYRKQFRDANRIELKCPQEEGRWSPKQLGIPTKVGHIAIDCLDIFFRGNCYSIMLVFATRGPKNADIKDRVMLEIYGHNGSLLDYVTDSYMDSRIGTELSSDLVTINLNTPTTNLSDIDRLVISAYRM